MVIPVTVSTIFTRTGSLFSEIFQNIIAQTSCCPAVSFHDLKPPDIPLPDQIFILSIHIRKIFAVQKHTVYHGVLWGKEQNTPGIFPITACTSCFLIIVLHALRHIVMNHITHVRLINSHSKSIGRHDHRRSVVDKIILIFLSGFIIKACMISGDRNAFFEKFLKQIVYIFPCCTVDNSAFCRMSVYVFHHKLIFPADIFHTVI